MGKKGFSALLVIGAYLGLVISAWANERRFTYTYESAVLPGGDIELELWNTFRFGREAYYGALDQRWEIELGLGGGVQTSLYLNTRNERISDGSGGSTASFKNRGVSTEWKFKMSDPVANRFGSALYLEAGLQLHELELEGKLILDKKFGPWQTALNIVFEEEFAYLPSKPGLELAETVLEFDWGIGRQVGKSSFLGLEVRNHNEIIEGDWEHSVLFAGPVVSVAKESWWLTWTLLPQITDLKKGEGPTRNRNLSEHEKVEIRMLFGVHL